MDEAESGLKGKVENSDELLLLAHSSGVELLYNWSLDLSPLGTQSWSWEITKHV